MKRLAFVIYGIIGSLYGLAAQNVLTLQDAIQTAIANNYAIVIAKNDQEASKYARNIGNAGMLPTIGLSGSATYSNNNIRQETSSGNVLSQAGVEGTNYTGSVQLSWVLFDGLKMFATYDRLTQLKGQSEVKTRIELEDLMVQVMTAYFEVVKSKQILISLQENISLSEERVTISETKLAIGSGSKTEVLQSKIDLNNFKAQWLVQNALVEQNKTNLNTLLSRDPLTAFEVEDSIPLVTLPSITDIRNNAKSNNSQVLVDQYNININKYARREINASRFPKLTFNASYNFSRAQNKAGFFLLNQNLGLNTGISLSYTIFDSWKVNTQYKLAGIALENSKQQLCWTQLQADAAIVKGYSTYSAYKSQSDLFRENLNMAKENVTLSMERFKQGLSNYIELREAQKSYVEVVTSYVNAYYALKLQEVELLRLQGGLIKAS